MQAGAYCLRVLLGAALAVSLSFGYVRNERRAGLPLVRDDVESILYFLSDSTAPGLLDSQGELTITPGSNPVDAVRQAIASWNSVEASRIGFVDPLIDPAQSLANDGRNLITFADTARNRALVGGAVAVTVLISNSAGVLTDTDVVFNPNLPFSTTLAAGTFDIEATLAHELGHVLGLDHSGVLSATMFATTGRATNRLASLTSDDRAFASEVYPASANHLGAVVGSVKFFSGGAVRGALVHAADVRNNVVVGSISEPDGGYRIGGLPPGDYLIYAEPLDGPAKASQMGFSRRGAQTQFRTVFFGGASPLTVSVAGGGETRVDLAVESTSPSLNPLGAGAAEPGGMVGSRAGARMIPGKRYRVELNGPGLAAAAITLDSIRFLGSGIEKVPGSLTLDTISFSDGTVEPRLSFLVDVAEWAPRGMLSVLIAGPDGVAVLTGGAEIEEARPTPLVNPGGVVHAASFLDGPISPGQIISIFGTELGPSEGIAASFDPVTGELPRQLGGASVLVDGVPAAFFFASSQQLNVQAPLGLTPGGVSILTVLRDGVASVGTIVATAAVAPALFVHPETSRAVAINADGSLNDPARPARRGEHVTIYGSGHGALTPTVALGAPAEGSLSLVDANVTALIGGRPAEVTFAGAAPGFVGLLQLNVRIAADAATGPQTLTEVSIGGVPAPFATVAVD